MDILFLCLNTSDSCAWYRSTGVVKDLQRKTNDKIIVADWSKVRMDWDILTQYDLIMLQKPYTRQELKMCYYIKHCGIKLWIDYDDNLLAVNPENAAGPNLYHDPAIQENIKGILKLADAVSVPTEYLKQCLLSYNENIFVIPNAFNDSILSRPELPKRTNQVVWRGPESHILDLMTYSGAINQCTEEFSDWRFIFVGYYPWFLHETTNKGFNKWILDIIVYYKFLFDLAPSVVHVPLFDNVFNRCRSNVAYIESSFAGAVTVCPDWWNVPGSLPYSTPQQYYEAVKNVLSGHVNKKALNIEAWEYVMDCLRLSKINVLRLELINSLI
jgi:glycosyltransferase involved in cell wall biosynthesis